MYICAIDPGIVNLGLVYVHVENEIITRVLFTGRIDLTNLPHKKVCYSQCTLNHTKDACDRVSHFIQEYRDILDQADLILMERQPLGGLVHIEQLLYHHFREKTLLQSPNRIYSHFGIRDLDYDQRKQASVQRLLTRLGYLPDFIESVQKNYQDRLHDISDAFGLIFYYMETKETNVLKETNEIKKTNKTNEEPEHVSKYFLDSYFQQYKFIQKPL